MAKFAYRHVITLCCMLSTLTTYIGRINLSVAIVDMAEPTQSEIEVVNLESENNFNSTSVTKPQISDVCFNEHYHEQNLLRNQSLSSYEAPRFAWDNRHQGFILGSFFYGYVAMLPVGGRLVDIFGARLLCFICIFGTGLINLLTPLLTQVHVLFIASRIVLGIVQAALFPSCYALASRWTPDQERSVVLSLPLVGASAGSIMASSLAGYLSTHGFAGGWPSVFYVSGLIDILFAALYLLLVRNDPYNHPWVSKQECDYIASNIANLRDSSTVKRPPFPWRRVARSRPINVANFVKFAVTWFYLILQLKMPDYLRNILGMTIAESGYFNSIILGAFCISHVIGGLAADAIIKRNYLPKITVRKCFESIATFGTAIILLTVPLSGCSRTAFVWLMIAVNLTLGMQAGGELPLWGDMTNEFTATIYGLANMISMVNGIIGPLIIGALLDAQPAHKRLQWAYIFYFSAALCAIGGVVFVLLGTSDRQPWDSGTDEAVCHGKDEDTEQKSKINFQSSLNIS